LNILKDKIVTKLEFIHKIYDYKKKLGEDTVNVNETITFNQEKVAVQNVTINNPQLHISVNLVPMS